MHRADTRDGLQSLMADLPASVRFDQRPGGMDRLIIGAPAASAVIDLQGAHVASWAPTTGQDDVLWVSTRSAFAPGAPIRGGIPICYPWFGPHPTNPSAPLHGLARTALWGLESAVEADGDVVVALSLDTATLPDADHLTTRLRYTVRIGRELRVELHVTNDGREPVVVEEAFHTYLSVDDVRSVTLHGLETAPGVDRLTGRRLSPSGGPVTVQGETDRLLSQPGEIRVDDAAGGRSITVRADSSANAVVWNPGPAKAATMPDFGDEEWTGMLCVETCNVADGRIEIAPGASHSMAATLTVQHQ